MGELIELLFKAVAWLVVVSAYLAWHMVRLAALAVVYVIGLTTRLVGQITATQYSPDRRYWWNGRAWIETTEPAGMIQLIDGC